MVHVSDEAAAGRVPPSVQRLEEFFGVLRDRVGTARKYAAAARDYALFRTLYWTGLRCGEAVLVDVGDLHWDRGPFGK
jgi:integrase